MTCFSEIFIQRWPMRETCHFRLGQLANKKWKLNNLDSPATAGHAQLLNKEADNLHYHSLTVSIIWKLSTIPWRRGLFHPCFIKGETNPCWVPSQLLTVGKYGICLLELKTPDSQGHCHSLIFTLSVISYLYDLLFFLIPIIHITIYNKYFTYILYI